MKGILLLCCPILLPLSAGACRFVWPFFQAPVRGATCWGFSPRDLEAMNLKE